MVTFVVMKTTHREYFLSVLPAAEQIVAQVLTPQLCQRAAEQNGWFVAEDVVYAAEAIRSRMLSFGEVERWLAAYNPATDPLTVGVVAAGNIPMAGFFDMFCVLAAGHRCKLKCSHKENILLPALAEAFVQRLGFSIEPFVVGEKVDMLIASGGDVAMHAIDSLYPSVPKILRSHRSSVAVLTGGERDEQLAALADDMFRYNSLGCRNITMLFVPEGYDVVHLVERLQSGRELVVEGYMNNYRQAKATAMLTGREVIDGGYFLLSATKDFSARLSEVSLYGYKDLAEVAEWLAEQNHRVQCVVGQKELLGKDIAAHERLVPIGSAQSPRLTDYPDGVDTMLWLTERI